MSAEAYAALPTPLVAGAVDEQSGIRLAFGGVSNRVTYRYIWAVDASFTSSARFFRSARFIPPVEINI